MEKEKIIVAASGYFDPIHIGHIEYLREAKRLGDKLIVIVNNDKQTVLKKGYEFMPVKERVEIVKALKFVDEVFVSLDEDKSVCKSLEVVKPDIFAKGGDRFSYEIPEAKVCKKLGIKIVHGLGDKIQSSSELIEKNKKV
ncbi:MAG: adenylyltransferase/cytidyltransferase family protein [Candidatus Woesearchaeota archaeon]